MLICNCGRGFGPTQQIIEIDEPGLDVFIEIGSQEDGASGGLNISYACNGEDLQSATLDISLEPFEYLISSRIFQLNSSPSYAENDFDLILHTWRYPYGDGEWADRELSDSGNWHRRRFEIEFENCRPNLRQTTSSN